EQNPENQVSEARWASPSPSEAAIYEALFELASGFSQKAQETQRTRVARALLPTPFTYARDLSAKVKSTPR
ncbi:hypothetical protein ACWQV9_10375, partial [Brevundimonas diminuta]